jgi:hypothetical protein
MLRKNAKLFTEFTLKNTSTPMKFKKKNTHTQNIEFLGGQPFFRKIMMEQKSKQ